MKKASKEGNRRGLADPRGEADGQALKTLKKKGKVTVKAKGQIHPDRRQANDEDQDRQALHGKEEEVAPGPATGSKPTPPGHLQCPTSADVAQLVEHFLVMKGSAVRFRSSAWPQSHRETMKGQYPKIGNFEGTLLFCVASTRSPCDPLTSHRPPFTQFDSDEVQYTLTEVGRAYVQNGSRSR